MARQRALEEAIQICHDFQDSVNAILEWLPDAEEALDSLEPLSDDYDTITQQIQELLVIFTAKLYLKGFFEGSQIQSPLADDWTNILNVRFFHLPLYSQIPQYRSWDWRKT